LKSYVCRERSYSPSKDQQISIYWPKGREFSPALIIEQLLKAGYNVCLPVVQEDSRILKFAQWNESIELHEGPYKVMQPVVDQNTVWCEPDILIVPLLAFDRRGYRLGYGGGYYDATIEDLRSRKSITAVGLGYGQQAVIFNLPIESHDQKLDWVITPLEAKRFP
jgi:5-formyltetrahydrofolate cyclo-ligase